MPSVGLFVHELRELLLTLGCYGCVLPDAVGNESGISE